MDSALFFVACFGLCAAMTVVAWLRYPRRDGSVQLGLVRFLGPLGALILIPAMINSVMRALTGNVAGEPSPIGWNAALIAAGLMVFAVAWAVNELRHSRAPQLDEEPIGLRWSKKPVKKKRSHEL